MIMKLKILKHAQIRLRQRFKLNTKEEMEKFIKEQLKDCEVSTWGSNMAITSADGEATFKVIDFQREPKMITAIVGIPYRYQNGGQRKQYENPKVMFE
jgi:hypothetical protein